MLMCTLDQSALGLVQLHVFRGIDDMDMPNVCVVQLAELIACLVAKDYTKIFNNGWLGRLSVQEVDVAISQYGRTLILPPQDFLDHVDVYELNDGSGWFVDAPLWTLEEGMSDLTLSVSVKISGDGFYFI
jgi:hypothetical protein